MTDDVLFACIHDRAFDEMRSEFRAYLSDFQGARVHAIDAPELAVLKAAADNGHQLAGVLVRAAGMIMDPDRTVTARCFMCTQGIPSGAPLTCMVAISPLENWPQRLLFQPVCERCNELANRDECALAIAERDVMPPGMVPVLHGLEPEVTTEEDATRFGSEDEIAAFVASLRDQALDVVVFGPHNVVDLLDAAREGNFEAQKALTAAQSCIESGVGLPCLCCQQPVASIVGGVVMVSKSDERDDPTQRMITMPVCRECIGLTPNKRTSMIKAGLRRELELPGGEFK